MPVKTSSLVRARLSTPESATAWRTRTPSNQPQRRGPPVVDPYSSPSGPRQCFAKPRLVEEVTDADAGARHLVLVGRPDAAPRGADLPRAAQPLPCSVDGAVVGHDEVRLLADPEPGVVRQVAPRPERVDLARQYLGVDDHAG